MPKRVEFEGVVHEFPDDFSDDDISAALAAYSDKPMASHEPMISPGVVTGGALAGVGAMRAAPGIMAIANKATGMVDAVGTNPLVRMATGPAVQKGAGIAADLTKAAGTRASALVGPSGEALSVATQPGILMRGANAMSKAVKGLGAPIGMASGILDAARYVQSVIEDPSTPPELKRRLQDALEHVTDPNSIPYR